MNHQTCQWPSRPARITGAPRGLSLSARLLLLLVTVLLLSGCIPRRAERSDFSAVQLSELRQDGDEWVMRLQLSNFAFEDPIDIEQLGLKLVVNGQVLVDRIEPMQLYLPALGIEAWQLRTAVKKNFASSEQMHYELSGSVRTRQYGRSFDYQYEGTLSAVPGIADAWR